MRIQNYRPFSIKAQGNPEYTVALCHADLLYEGKLVADDPISSTRLRNIIEKEFGINAKTGR